MKVGVRLKSSACSTEVMVIRASASVTEIECCGQPMVPSAGSSTGDDRPDSDSTEMVEVGKRYENEELGIEVLCIKSGKGTLTVGGTALTMKIAKPLPSSD
jgi:hypothetical protein